MASVEERASELGELIRERRRFLGLSQATLAELAGVSVRVLSSIEGGKPTARLDTLLPVLEALGLEVLVVPRRIP